MMESVNKQAISCLSTIDRIGDATLITALAGYIRELFTLLYETQITENGRLRYLTVEYLVRYSNAWLL